MLFFRFIAVLCLTLFHLFFVSLKRLVMYPVAMEVSFETGFLVTKITRLAEKCASFLI